MIFELRAYDLKAGAGPDYAARFARSGVSIVTRSLPLVGFWMTESGVLNRLYHLWAYADLGERAACRTALAADGDWTEGFVPGAFPLILRQENRLMRLVEGSEALSEAVAKRRSVRPAIAPEDPALASGLHELVTGSPGATPMDRIGAFEIASGGVPGTSVTLRADPSLDAGRGSGRHELLRPLSCSPLR